MSDHLNSSKVNALFQRATDLNIYISENGQPSKVLIKLSHDVQNHVGRISLAQETAERCGEDHREEILDSVKELFNVLRPDRIEFLENTYGETLGDEKRDQLKNIADAALGVAEAMGKSAQLDEIRRFHENIASVDSSRSCGLG
jgi:hypothetical protein